MIGGDLTLTDVPIVEVVVKPGSSADFPIILAVVLFAFFVAIVVNVFVMIWYWKKIEVK